MKRRLSYLLLFAVLFASWKNSAYTFSNGDTNNPMYTYISGKSADLSVNEGKATVLVTVNGYSSSVDKCLIDIELQEKSGFRWVSVKSWSTTSNSYSASIYEEYAVSSGKQYRISGTVKVWAGNKTESAPVTSNIERSK